jgi:hypothetical protein
MIDGLFLPETAGSRWGHHDHPRSQALLERHGDGVER